MPSRSCVILDTTVALCLGLALVLAPLLTPVLSGPLRADEKPAGSSCSCPAPGHAPRENPWPRPKYAEAKPHLEAFDEVAALEALHLTLTEVADGAFYVWQLRNGQVSGVMQPTASFRDARGRICRHIVLQLSSGMHTKRTEGMACRLDSGGWQLEG